MPAAAVPAPISSSAQRPALMETVPAGVRSRLTQLGHSRSLARGEVAFTSTDRPSRCAIVERGMLRVILEAADGRKVAARYAREGGIVGLMGAMLGDTVPMAFQAVTSAEILDVPADALRELAAENPDFSVQLARELSYQLESTMYALADASFGTVRSRLARHLLERLQDTDEPLVVEATHQELADSIGTVREVVARLLGALREAGLVTTSRGIITISSIDALSALVGQWVPRHR